jgi:hypothetical protein
LEIAILSKKALLQQGTSMLKSWRHGNVPLDYSCAFEKKNKLSMEDFVNKFFPTDSIPTTKHANQHYMHFSTDIPVSEHPREYSQDISYKFNSHGYRCDEFVQSDKFKIMSIGCSNTFGVGVPVNKRFSYIFGEINKTEFLDWNVALPGQSCDYIGRMVSILVPILKPDCLIVHFPSFARREYFDFYGRKLDYHPYYNTREMYVLKLFKNIDELVSDYEDVSNFLINYNLVRSICLLNKIPFVYSIQESYLEIYKAISKKCDEELCVYEMEGIDSARDDTHPGVRSHYKHGVKLYDKYISIYKNDNTEKIEVMEESQE